jgi:DNA primase
VRLSNPRKVLYPAVGFTKTDVLEYYQQIAGRPAAALAAGR